MAKGESFERRAGRRIKEKEVHTGPIITLVSLCEVRRYVIQDNTWGSLVSSSPLNEISTGGHHHAKLHSCS